MVLIFVAGLNNDNKISLKLSAFTIVACILTRMVTQILSEGGVYFVRHVHWCSYYSRAVSIRGNTVCMSLCACVTEKREYEHTHLDVHIPHKMVTKIITDIHLFDAAVL